MKGLRDLMTDATNTELQKELIKRGATGNWYSSMNVSNLINGTKPKDPNLYIILADIFNVTTEEIIKRFSHE